MFPVGTKSGYAPVTVSGAGNSDTLGVSVMDDSVASPYGGRVLTRWNVSGTQSGVYRDSIQFTWQFSMEDGPFKNNMAGNAKLYCLSSGDTLESGSGPYVTQLTANPYSLARGGVSALGSFVIGNFGTGTHQTAVNSLTEVPRNYTLSQNYPNPFNPSTSIHFELPVESRVTITMYDILGRLVETLIDKNEPAGRYTIEWIPSKLSSGIYFYRIQAQSADGSKEFLQVRKLMLMK